MLLKKVRAITNLIRWYTIGEGKKEKLYQGIQQKTIHLKNNNPKRSKVKVYCYYPTSFPLGGYLLTPGLHPLGADHPKMRDFALMLCSLGYLVYSPHVKDYSKLCVVKETLDDYMTVFDALYKDPLLPKIKKIHIFSISFGSLLALRLASNKKRSKQVSSVTIFGGFGSWRSTSEAIMHNIFPDNPFTEPADIRSVPAIYNHIIEHLPNISHDNRVKIKKYWLTFMKKTWVDEAYLDRTKCLHLAEKMAKNFSGREKKIFLQGLGAHKESLKLYKEIMEKETYEHLNPLQQTKEISCSIYLIHGKYDELIPATQQKIIKEALPQHLIQRAFLTKLYAHSEKAKLETKKDQFINFISELRNMFRIILTLSLPKSHN